MGEHDQRYENAVIYTIKTDDGLYVGSTINYHNRKKEHKSKVNLNCKTLLYQNINSAINKGDYKIQILHMYPCSNKLELRLEERRVMDELNANLNVYRPYASPEEKYIQNTIHNRSQYMKNFKRRRVKCECGIEMNNNSLSRHLKTERHHDALKIRMQADLLGFLTCKPTENIVITKTNNSHTTPYPSEDEDE